MVKREEIITHHFTFFLGLWIPEVLVKAQAIRALNAESFKLVIVSHLMAWCHLIGSNWHSLAVNLNSSYGVHESI